MCQVTLKWDSDSSAVLVKLGSMPLRGRLAETVENRKLMRTLKDKLEDEDTEDSSKEGLRREKSDRCLKEEKIKKDMRSGRRRRVN